MSESIEEILRNRVKFIGDDYWELKGTPAEAIKELENYVLKLLKSLEEIKYPPSGKEYWFKESNGLEWTNDLSSIVRGSRNG